MKFFSKLNNLFFGYFDPITNFLIIKISNFRGDLSDISAKTATLMRVSQKHIVDFENKKTPFVASALSKPVSWLPLSSDAVAAWILQTGPLLNGAYIRVLIVNARGLDRGLVWREA